VKWQGDGNRILWCFGEKLSYNPSFPIPRGLSKARPSDSYEKY